MLKATLHWFTKINWFYMSHKNFSSLLNILSFGQKSIILRLYTGRKLSTYHYPLGQHCCKPYVFPVTCMHVLQPRQYEQQLFYLAGCLCRDIKAVNLASKTPLTGTSNDSQARYPVAAMTLSQWAFLYGMASSLRIMLSVSARVRLYWDRYLDLSQYGNFTSVLALIDCTILFWFCIRGQQIRDTGTTQDVVCMQRIAETVLFISHTLYDDKPDSCALKI